MDTSLVLNDLDIDKAANSPYNVKQLNNAIYDEKKSNH